MPFGQKLISDLLVGPLAPAATVTLSHGIREHDQDVAPNEVFPDRATPIVVTSTTSTQVTFRNDGTSPQSAVFRCLRWHSFEERQTSLVPVFSWQGNPGAGAAVTEEKSFLPEAWEHMDIAAGLVAQPVAAAVSQLFDDVEMVRAGSLTGLDTRLTEAVLAGTLTITVSINGVATAFAIVHTSVSNPTGGRSTLAAGTISFVAGDLIGVLLDSSIGFLPNTADISVRVEVSV